MLSPASAAPRPVFAFESGKWGRRAAGCVSQRLRFWPALAHYPLPLLDPSLIWQGPFPSLALPQKKHPACPIPKPTSPNLQAKLLGPQISARGTHAALPRLFLVNAALLYTQAIEAGANHFPMDFCSPNIPRLAQFSAQLRGPRRFGSTALSRAIRLIWGCWGRGAERRKDAAGKGGIWGKGRALKVR